ncbi:MAG: hypothetical protein U0821_13775 [Chloroflexota bacterium]
MRCSRRKVLATLSLAPLALALGGCQAAPAAAPAGQAPAAGSAAKLFIATDMVWGSKNLVEPLKSKVSCTLTSRFPRNSEMVWRVRVYDPATGEVMDKAAMQKVEVKLANGTAIDMQFGPHPKDPPGEAFWTGSWVVPKEAPTGTLNYTVTATDTKGRTGEWKPFSTAPSLPIILDEVLPDAPAKA